VIAGELRRDGARVLLAHRSSLGATVGRARHLTKVHSGHMGNSSFRRRSQIAASAGRWNARALTI
jgi:hypothetical protein